MGGRALRATEANDGYPEWQAERLPYNSPGFLPPPAADKPRLRRASGWLTGHYSR